MKLGCTALKDIIADVHAYQFNEKKVRVSYTAQKYSQPKNNC